MFDSSNIIAGIEIGTSKICVVVGEQAAGGPLNIIGIGQALTQGVRKGEIINPTEVEEDLRNAIAEAEQMADVEIRSVYLGVTGGHLRGYNQRGFHRVVAADREITLEDVLDVVENAKAVNLPAENSLVHTVRQHFLVDGEGGVSDPVGMHGAQLEVDMHIIHGKTNRLQNAIRLVRATSLQVNDIVFTGLASSLAVLTGEQKELGALIIDIGGGTTEYVVYAEGVLRYSGVLSIGGDHVANDLAYGLKVSLSRAEKLKLEHGSAVVTESARDQTIAITNEFGMELKRVKLEHVQRIMSLRLEEIFQVIAEELAAAGLTEFLRAGVFLTGGCAHTPGIVMLAEKTFQMNVALGQAGAMSGLATTLNQPGFAAALGLVQYGALRQHQPSVRPSWLARLKEFIKKLLNFVR